MTSLDPQLFHFSKEELQMLHDILSDAEKRAALYHIVEFELIKEKEQHQNIQMQQKIRKHITQS